MEYAAVKSLLARASSATEIRTLPFLACSSNPDTCSKVARRRIFKSDESLYKY